MFQTIPYYSISAVNLTMRFYFIYCHILRVTRLTSVNRKKSILFFQTSNYHEPHYLWTKGGGGANGVGPSNLCISTAKVFTGRQDWDGWRLTPPYLFLGVCFFRIVTCFLPFSSFLSDCLSMGPRCPSSYQKRFYANSI